MKPKKKPVILKDGLLKVGEQIPFKDFVTGEEFMAELIAVLEETLPVPPFGHVTREFALFSIENEPNSYDIMALLIEQDENGNDVFVEIEDAYDLLRMHRYVVSLMCKMDPSYINKIRDQYLQNLCNFIDALDESPVLKHLDL